MTGPIRSRSSSSPDDQSSVRERTPVPSASPSVPPASPSVPPPPPGAQPTPRARLEQKLVLARSLLARLPLTDDRARLLHIAVLRRDESLLDGVLAALDPHPDQGEPKPR
jgi:hypothetical protein